MHLFRKTFANIRPSPACHGISKAVAAILWALYPRSILEFRLVYLHDLLPGATINWRFSRNKDLIPFQKLMYAQLNPIASDAFFSISARTFTESCGNTGDYELFFVSRKMTKYSRPLLGRGLDIKQLDIIQSNVNSGNYIYCSIYSINKYSS